MKGTRDRSLTYTLTKALILIAGAFFATRAASAGPVITTSSPDGRIILKVTTDATGHLSYTLTSGPVSVVRPSHIGVTIDGMDLGQDVSLGHAQLRRIDETYPLLGVHPTATNKCNEAIIPLTTGAGKTPWSLEVRAYNDGAAYRYRIPGQGTRMLNGETSSWILPDDARIWFQNDLGSYEGLYTSTTVGSIQPNTVVAFPATLQLSSHGPYATITEADLVNYSDMVVRSGKDHALEAFFHANSGGWATQGEILTPWRVTLVASDLNALVNSDLVHNLCPAPSSELANADWIQPGRSTWQWWSSGSPKLDEQHQYVDWTRQLGFEYYLIDEGWEGWKSADGKDDWETLKELVRYAKTQGVKIVIWAHSKEVFKPEDREAFFAKAKDCGVAGLKIDFPPRGRVDVVNWYVDVLRDAARLHLVVDFHGAIKPTGLDRTWPNELSREAVRGHEYQIIRFNRTLPPEHDTILPFTRYIAGHADYTPTAFNPAELRGYTWSRELAQAIVFTSPFLCYADKPSLYLQNPALDVLKAIPSTWDETIVLPGSEIGKVAAFARRKGDAWFIGVINGGESTRLTIDLRFLGPRQFMLTRLEDVSGKEDAVQKSHALVRSTDHLDLELRGMGGFVGWFTVDNAHP